MHRRVDSCRHRLVARECAESEATRAPRLQRAKISAFLHVAHERRDHAGRDGIYGAVSVDVMATHCFLARKLVSLEKGTGIAIGHRVTPAWRPYVVRNKHRRRRNA